MGPLIVVVLFGLVLCFREAASASNATGCGKIVVPEGVTKGFSNECTARFGSIDLANRFADRCKNCDMSVACCDVAKAATYEWTSTISHASLESYDSQGDCEACMASVPCSWNCDSRNNAVNAAKPSGIFGVVLSSVLLANTAMM